MVVQIWKYFHPNLGQSDNLIGGEFFAALRSVIHAEGGDGIDRGLAFVQGTFLFRFVGSLVGLPSGHDRRTG